jgi:RES domain-containing protein
MRVWRICKSIHAARAFTGEGAILYAGRWHRRGVPVVYASESRALAALELLVHLHRNRLPPSFVSFAVDVPDDLNVIQLRAKDLPPEWHQHPAPAELQDLGTLWAEARRSVCLQVPSAVVRGEHNFLINPRHPDFDQLRIGKPEPFELDQRLIR